MWARTLFCADAHMDNTFPILLFFGQSAHGGKSIWARIFFRRCGCVTKEEEGEEDAALIDETQIDVEEVCIYVNAYMYIRTGIYICICIRTHMDMYVYICISGRRMRRSTFGCHQLEQQEDAALIHDTQMYRCKGVSIFICIRTHMDMYVLICISRRRRMLL